MKLNSKMVLFSPNYEFSKLDWLGKEFTDLDERDKLDMIRAFKERVNEFYLSPAKSLLKLPSGAFAAGALSAITIDFLARISLRKNYLGKNRISGKRFQEWFRQNINDEFAKDFYGHFRCGIIHEGRIKKSGMVTFYYPEDLEKKGIKPPIWREGKVLVVNPQKLINKIEDALNRYIHEVNENNDIFQEFWEAMVDDFHDDYRLAKKLLSS